MGVTCLATPRHNRYRPDNRYIFTFLCGNRKITSPPGMLSTAKHAKTRGLSLLNSPRTLEKNDSPPGETVWLLSLVGRKIVFHARTQLLESGAKVAELEP